MHVSALNYASLFFQTYCKNRPAIKILEIGSQNVNGSLRDVAPIDAVYTGVDFVPGMGVDVVLDDPYTLPFDSESQDVLVCSSVYEHSQFFWLLYLEMLRVLKPDGLLYLNAPSNGYIHRFPADCWRFYPDAGHALAAWGERNNYSPLLLESFTGEKSDKNDPDSSWWNDFVAVFVKEKKFQENYAQRIIDSITEYTNGFSSNIEGELNPAYPPPDFSDLFELRKIIHERNNEVEKLQNRIATLESELFAVRHSRSWRITKIIRRIGEYILRFKARKIAIATAARYYGGYGRLFNSAYDSYRKCGVSGVKKDIQFLLISHSREENQKKNEIRDRQPIRKHVNTLDVIVCVHNALDDVKKCLDSLVLHTTSPWRLIIVDDGSADETRNYLENFINSHSGLLIRHDFALGYTKAANAGLRISNAEFVVFLNSDTIVSPQWADRLIQCANSDENIGIVGPLSNTASWQSVPNIYNEAGDWADNPLPDGWSVEQYANELALISPQMYPRVGFVNGFCFLIKRGVINQIGYFDESAFPAGYGEENDYCLRASDCGWQLAIADDCYVFHAQSKSYSHERRFQLALQAGLSLSAKHGDGKIDYGLYLTQSHPSLLYMRKRCKDIEEIYNIKKEITDKYAGRRILFLLPARTAGGGSNVVLFEAEKMRSLGIDACIANLNEDREIFESHHPKNTVPVIYLKELADLDEIASEFDAVIATLFLSVFWMHWMHRWISNNNGPVCGYYIQDFEPNFFEQDTEFYKLSIRSYTEIPGLKLFTKTKWTQQALAGSLGLSPMIIGPSVNVDIFCPASLQKNLYGSINILAMVRPFSPRRAADKTMNVLKALSEKFGKKIKITIFGVSEDDPDFINMNRDFDYISLGLIDLDRVRSALSSADIFIDCSTYQAMGLTAMEAMASGAVAIGPINGGLGEIITHNHNGLLVNTDNEAEIVEAASLVIEDETYRQLIRSNAFEVLSNDPVKSSYRMLKTIFG